MAHEQPPAGLNKAFTVFTLEWHLLHDAFCLLQPITHYTTSFHDREQDSSLSRWSCVGASGAAGSLLRSRIAVQVGLSDDLQCAAY